MTMFKHNKFAVIMLTAALGTPGPCQKHLRVSLADAVSRLAVLRQCRLHALSRNRGW